MLKAKELFDYDSLAFFGRVNASISHELKNILAIISETAGLLGDLSEMASKGTPVDPEMLKSSTDSIMEEIQRGFTTIRQMNRFSHSVDTPIVSIDLMKLLDLVCHLSNYLSFAGKTRLAPWNGPSPVAETSPFVLQAIVYELVYQHFKNAGPNSVLDIAVGSNSSKGWMIEFSSLRIKEFQVFPDPSLKRAAASIAVSIDWDRSNRHLKLYVPANIFSGAVVDDSAERTDDGGMRPVQREST
ncbi:MAG: hypothetical protein PVJ53_00245 [Desulfobacterales bacterium]|jgi:hypothetical protein